MDGNRTAVSDRLAHWRGQQLDRHDPVQFAFLEALQRRAQLASGSLRGVLDARLETLLAAYAERMAAAPVATALPKTAGMPDTLAALGQPRATHNPDYPALPAQALRNSARAGSAG